jgi:hypothetical protein
LHYEFLLLFSKCYGYSSWRLQKYSHPFSVNDYDLGLTHLVEHTIDTGDAKPVKQPPRRVPIAFAEEEKKLIMQMQEQGIIRKSSCISSDRTGI